MKYVRFGPLKYFLVAFISLLLLSCSNSNEKLTIASHVWPGYEFMFLARNLGHLDSKLVSLKETNSASETILLLKQGKIDGGALTFDEVIRARNEGIELVVVLVFDVSAGADVVVAKPEITQLEQLLGKTIVLEVGSVGSIMLDQLLKKANLAQDQVKLMTATIDQHLDYWKQGLADAVISYEPVSGKIMDLGGKTIFSSQQAPNLIVDVLAIKKASLYKTDAIKHLIESHFLGQSHYNSHHQDALYRMAPRLDLPALEVDSVFKGILLPDYQNNLRLLSGKNPELLKSEMQLREILQMQNPTQADPVSDRIIDDSFLVKIKP